MGGTYSRFSDERPGAFYEELGTLDPTHKKIGPVSLADYLTEITAAKGKSELEEALQQLGDKFSLPACHVPKLVRECPDLLGVLRPSYDHISASGAVPMLVTCAYLNVALASIPVGPLATWAVTRLLGDLAAVDTIEFTEFVATQVHTREALGMRQLTVDRFRVLLTSAAHVLTFDKYRVAMSLLDNGQAQVGTLARLAETLSRTTMFDVPSDVEEQMEVLVQLFLVQGPHEVTAKRLQEFERFFTHTFGEVVIPMAGGPPTEGQLAFFKSVFPPRKRLDWFQRVAAPEYKSFRLMKHNLAQVYESLSNLQPR